MIAILANLTSPSSADKMLVSHWIAGGENLEAEVARCNLGSGGLAVRKLAEGSVGEDLTSPCGWHLWRWRQAVKDVAKIQTS